MDQYYDTFTVFGVYFKSVTALIQFHYIKKRGQKKKMLCSTEESHTVLEHECE